DETWVLFNAMNGNRAEMSPEAAGTRSQLINSIDILRARRATGLMTRDNYRTVNNITLGKYPEAK
ncbi:TA system toxin CbtA family protein, partial [Escherichia coli]|nr:TA system toxin CbtA family protein [Escherichia coli]